MTLHIYVVYHRTFDDTNIFFTDINKAQAKVKEFKALYNDEFYIKVIKEGETFYANMNF